MADDDTAEEREVWGTTAADAPVPRADFERALRRLNLSDLKLREQHLQLVAQVVALTEELARRGGGGGDGGGDGSGGGDGGAGGAPRTAALAERRAQIAERLQLQELERPAVDLAALLPSKYEVPSPDVPCVELLPICQARCCRFEFPLSSEDLDEGVIRWDHGRPYMIRQRASDGYCVHNDPERHVCSVHPHRPRVCRVFDCREDPRIWKDFARRELAELPEDQRLWPSRAPRSDEIDLLARVRARSVALWAEEERLVGRPADATAARGPVPPPPQPPPPDEE